MGVRRRYDRHSARIRATARWRAVRQQALRRDGYRCVSCGAPGHEVDHIIRVMPDTMHLAYAIDNLQTLCTSCHSRKTAIETGIAPLDPERRKWRDLLRESQRMPRPTEGQHYA